MSKDLQQQAAENRILEIRSGSHLYGTNTSESDEDYVGIFMPPEEYVFGLKSVQEIDLGIKDKDKEGKNTSEAVDRKLYEFRKFINLAQGNNPNILEVLFINKENILFLNDIGEELLKNRHLFPSKLTAKKFVGYAHSQKHKMIIRRDHFNELSSGYEVLEVTEDKLTMGQLYDRMNNSFDGKGIFFKKETGHYVHVGDICFEPGVYVKKARKKLKERLDKATNRSELVLRYGYDTKFASHLIRLLTEGIHLLKFGKLEFPLHNAEMILEIKHGDWDIEKVIAYANALERKLDQVLEASPLPATPYHKEIETLTIRLMKKHLGL